MMRLQLDERPYSGKSFRPRPEILIDDQTGLLVIATPWGPRSAARKAIERISNYLALSREDDELTSPFERLSCLSTQANNLRIAALLANEAIYREDNQDEYRSGVEIFAAMIDDTELVWVQAGNPQILLSRDGQSLLPIGSQIDLSFDLGAKGELLAPLPSQLLGLDSSLNPNINSFRARAGDRVILLSHSHIPGSLFSLSATEMNIESLSRRLANLHPDGAFWLGILSITERP